MTGRRADILMITYRSAEYLELSLPRLLDSCRDSDRVWLWHNGDDEATIEALRPYRRDPRVEHFHHSRENVRLREPTNWMWSQSNARYVSKVDDDSIVQHSWLDTLTAAHEANPEFGVVGSWHLPDEDFVPELAHQKIQTFRDGHSLLRNLWVQGSGYVMRAATVERCGVLRPDESFTRYCIRVAKRAGINGFHFPFVRFEHMDDPRAPHSLVRTDEQLRRRLPLSAQANGIRTVDDWLAQIRRNAVTLQSASLDFRQQSWWRRKVRSVRRRSRTLVGGPGQW